MKEKKFYRFSGKLAVVLALLAAVWCAAFGIIQILSLSSIGLTPNAAARKYTFEQTATCGVMVQKQLNDVLYYYEEGSAFGTNGAYDGKKEIDIVAYATEGKQSGGENTSYTVDQLLELYQQSVTDQLEEFTSYGVEDWASNDAGIDKEAYAAYESGEFQIAGDTSDAGNSQTATASEEVNATDETATASEEVVIDGTADAGRLVLSGKQIEELDQFAPDGSVYQPSEEVQKEFAAKKTDTKDVSSRFLYLYENGRNTETIQTKGGQYLYEYALENFKTVSLLDLYRDLEQTARAVHEYKDKESTLSALETDTNLQYFLEDEKGNIYTNTAEWKKGYDNAISGKYAFAVVKDSEDGNEKIRSLAQTKHSNAVEVVKGYLQNNELAQGYQRILVALEPGMPKGDAFSQYSEMYSKWQAQMPLLFVMACGGSLAAVICLVLLTVQAGRREEDNKIHLCFFDEWYTELTLPVHCLFVGVAIMVFGFGFSAAYDSVNYIQNFYGDYVYGEYGNNADMWRTLVGAFIVLGCTVLVLIPYGSLVRRIKARNLWKRSFLYQICKAVRTIYEERKEAEQMMILFAVFCGLQIFLIWGCGTFGVLLCLILDAAVLLLLLKEISGRRRIQQGLQKIAAGDLEYQIDTAELSGENLKTAETINSLGEGLKAAVQEQMKSERLKADLITNVSHDIKTPLTSIINYVDLLKREQIEDPKIKGYIQVLDEKSQRLKQLTVDLVEASKISSGNIKLEFMNLNLNELVQQVNGEFLERLESRNLDLICVLQPEPLVIRADSRRIWRVLENLYVNVCKYAMPGTRVYVDAVRKDGKIQFSIKNISENALNFQAEELTERFIRGDVSRSTEGSGLGLSIAKNLTILQHGEFQVYLDGDLFKVTICFPEVESKTKQKEQKMEHPENPDAGQPFGDGDKVKKVPGILKAAGSENNFTEEGISR